MDSSKLQRADDLRIRLEKHFGGNNLDVLSLYRKWLDINEIPAEGKDGWPTEECYREENIQGFLKAI